MKIIQRWGVEYDAIDVSAPTRVGIVVEYLPRFLDDVVADYTWALMLGIARRIPWGQASMLEGEWKLSWKNDVVRRTLDVLGADGLGQQWPAARRVLKCGSWDMTHTQMMQQGRQE